MIMNTARKLGSHTQTLRGTCPGVGLWVYYKSRELHGGFRRTGARPWFTWLLGLTSLPNGDLGLHRRSRRTRGRRAPRRELTFRPRPRGKTSYWRPRCAS